jgi:hypothetical protein
MQLNLSIENPDLPKHKCLALGIFADEKPPRGICGFIDWRLNGIISREIKQGRISGEFAEKIVIPFPRRIGAEALLLFGLGNISEINYDKIYNASYTITKSVDGMALNSFAFDLYGEGRSNLVTSNIVEAIITGMFDFLSKDIEKLSRMNVCAVTSSAKIQEFSLGIKQFKTNVNDRGSVDTGVIENG